MWIEYKFIVLPKRASTVIKPLDLLSGLQAEWIRGRKLEGRFVWVVIGTKDGGVVLDEDWDVELSTESFVARMLVRRDIANLIRGHIRPCSP